MTRITNLDTLTADCGVRLAAGERSLYLHILPGSDVGYYEVGPDDWVPAVGGVRFATFGPFSGTSREIAKAMLKAANLEV